MVSPVLTPYSDYNIYASEEAYEKQQEIWREQGKEIQITGQLLSCDAWEEQLRDVQYVFLYHPGDVFKESYGRLFEERDSIDDGAFYQVRQTEEGVRLELIGKVGTGTWK